jgi:CRISPR-associated endonuclease/helicase Cas3
VAERLRGAPQGLCILNSRKDSLEVFAELDDPEALYLSTLLCADHRREVLAKVKRRLAAGEPCRVVSTQVIEAGVDIDFPYVMRAMGPLESIVQAAGRANREGKMAGKGRVEIFDLEGGRMSPGPYETAFGVTRSFVPSRLHEMDMPALHAEYYADVFRSTPTDRRIKGVDGRMTSTVQQARANRDFERVRREARIIEEDTVSVVARGRDPERVDELLTTWMSPRKRFRELGRYSVSLRRREADEHTRAGLIRMDASGALIWVGGYSDKTGIATNVTGDPGDLIC